MVSVTHMEYFISENISDSVEELDSDVTFCDGDNESEYICDSSDRNTKLYLEKVQCLLSMAVKY
jgi:hypothetical protein